MRAAYTCYCAPVFFIAGAQIADPEPQPATLRIEQGRIAARVAAPPKGARVVDASGLVLVPAFIDAHVHLTIAGQPKAVAEAELRGGVAAVLDLGSPERLLPIEHAPLRIRFAGPLLTAPGGYPLQTWGKAGHGLALGTPEQARAAVRRLAQSKARFVKLAFDGRYPLLAADVAAAAAQEAHRLGLRVAAHALDAAAVRMALDCGAEVLAHTPGDELPADLLARMRGKWVISTLAAFAVLPERLRALHQHGARIAYGTDLGNEGTAEGIDARELSLLSKAGIDPLRAATLDAAELLELPDLGRLSPGAAASLVAVRDLAPEALAKPVWAMIDGQMMA